MHSLAKRYGWSIRLLLALLLVILLATTGLFRAPRLFGGADIVSASVVLGVSVVFTGVLVPCVFLIFYQMADISEMLANLTDIRHGGAHGPAVKGPMLRE
jgi:hypothetical protein